MVVAALYAVSKTGSYVEKEKRLWQEAVMSLVSNISPECLIKVPTPVCYELMAMNQSWYDHVTRYPKPLFSPASEAIPNTVIKKAAHYSFETNCNSFDGEKQKMKTMDPLIAAYSLLGGYYILTMNQHDFPESHFTVRNLQILSLQGKNGKYRSILYLLKPITP